MQNDQEVKLNEAIKKLTDVLVKLDKQGKLNLSIDDKRKDT